MPQATISFKNNTLQLNNCYELYIESDLWNGAVKLGHVVVIVNVTGKTQTEIKTEAKELLKTRAQELLEHQPPVLDLPGSVADFNLTVTYT